MGPFEKREQAAGETGLAPCPGGLVALLSEARLNTGCKLMETSLNRPLWVRVEADLIGGVPWGLGASHLLRR